MAKEKTTKNKHIALRVTIFFIIVALLALSYFFVDKIENFVNFAYNGKALSTNIDNQGLKVHFIDVDQADAILIEFPTGEKMLIDSGVNNSESENKLFSYLDKIEFKMEDDEPVIDYFLLTHSDADHIGNAEEVFNRYKIKKCIRPNIKSKSETVLSESTAVHETELYDKVITALANEVVSSGCISEISQAGLEIKSSAFVEENLNIDNSTWKISMLTPIVSCLPYKEGSKFNYNNYSPIMILQYMDKKIMFTGDAEKEVESDLLDYCETNDCLEILDVDVLKVGHHGSETSSTPEFLNYVKPEYAVIEVGKDNKYQHPKQETLDNLKAVGLSENDIYRTDKNGTILLGVSQNGELCLVADYVQYTTFKIEWWYLFTAGTLIAAIAIFVPLLSKKNQKKVKKAIKNSTKNNK
ncbi:MAG: MBL fold metallo-hydrolase [Firmicutes bacterium]|nr:MBL fold metallo-hydrolase [Bacillota bacterium]